MNQTKNMNQTTKNTEKQENIQQNTDFVDSKNGRLNKELILHNEDLESNIRKWKAPLKRGITMKTWKENRSQNAYQVTSYNRWPTSIREWHLGFHNKPDQMKIFTQGDENIIKRERNKKHIVSPRGTQIRDDLFIHPLIMWWVHRNRDRASTKPRKRQESKMGTLHGCDHLSVSVSLSAPNQASVWTQQRNQQCTAHFRNYSL